MRAVHSICISLLAPLAIAQQSAPPAPPAEAERITLTADNTLITRSCTVVIPPGAMIADADGNGVLHVEADDIDVRFEPGSVLRAADPMTPDDQLKGVGIRISGHKGVRLTGAVIDGFRVGLWADHASGLRVDGLNVTRNYRQRLASTPQAEVSSDWLWPHRNDNHEWRTTYGAAVCIEDSTDVVLRSARVRQSQNGIILDRVSASRIVDCDCSFLSGWGLAMWRSSGNLVSRNSMDFCIRGYSEGVYNRGQDSAGILVFEQCSDNSFVENSATHCGDGFFCFAGREALGEDGPRERIDYTGKGCNRNVLIGNDFSFAAAHGIELTFSFDNWIVNNKLIGNGICGVWGGYTQRTTIEGNRIERNGMPGAREGGGINIEHGAANLIRSNDFRDNTVAVSLWSDDDGELLKKPWALANHKGSVDNHIRDNAFASDTIGVRVRETTGTTGDNNTFERVGSNFEGLDVLLKADPPADRDMRVFAPEGDRQPLVGRSEIKDLGRGAIIMGPWGPWDRASPMLRLAQSGGSRVIYELFGHTGQVLLDDRLPGDLLETSLGDAEPDVPRTLTVGLRGPGVSAYRIGVRTDGIDEEISGTLIRCSWAARVFPWTVDPRNDLEGWRAESKSPASTVFAYDDLGWMRFGAKGPKDTVMLPEIKDRLPGPDRFGVVAATRVRLARGAWKFSTLSDDGIRILIDDKPVIENWTWHAPTRNEGIYQQTEDREVEIRIEYFEIDGHAVLEFQFAPA